MKQNGDRKCAADKTNYVRGRGKEVAERQMWLFRLRCIILHIARCDFGADSPNLKVTIWCPGLVQEKLWSPWPLKVRPGPSDFYEYTHFAITDLLLEGRVHHVNYFLATSLTLLSRANIIIS